jgi:phage baseplate assembly protein V
MIERLLNMVGIGRSTLADDSGDLQLLQITEGATGGGGSDRILEKVRRVAEFGFASVPPDGAEVLVLRRNGLRTQSIVIATSHRPSRLKNLKPGDAALYDVRGAKITLTDQGIEIDAAGGEVTITNATKIHADCDIETTGDIISRAGGVPVSLNDLHDKYNEHDHPPVGGASTWGVGPPNLQA